MKLLALITMALVVAPFACAQDHKYLTVAPGDKPVFETANPGDIFIVNDAGNLEKIYSASRLTLNGVIDTTNPGNLTQSLESLKPPLDPKTAKEDLGLFTPRSTLIVCDEGYHLHDSDSVYVAQFFREGNPTIRTLVEGDDKCHSDEDDFEVQENNYSQPVIVQL